MRGNGANTSFQSDDTAGMQFLAQKFFQAAHQGLDSCRREAPTAKSLTKKSATPTVALLRGFAFQSCMHEDLHAVVVAKPE